MRRRGDAGHTRGGVTCGKNGGMRKEASRNNIKCLVVISSGQVYTEERRGDRQWKEDRHRQQHREADDEDVEGEEGGDGGGGGLWRSVDEEEDEESGGSSSSSSEQEIWQIQPK